MPNKIVDANYRFIAASNEVNARIAQRQQALALYVSIVVSLLAVTVALRPNNNVSQAPMEWLALGFPVASISFAFLNYKAERAITNLRLFLSDLERIAHANEHLPSYNTDPKWSSGANKARRFHDYSVALLVGAGNAIGIGAAKTIFPQRFVEAPVFMYIAIILAVISLLLVLFTPQWSYAPKSGPLP